MSSRSDLEQYRARIDEIDDELLRLFNERIEIAAQVGKGKANRNESVYRPEREAQVIQRLVGANKGPLASSAVRFLFREIISLARCAEAPIRVAALGPRGTFSEQAAYKLFGQQIDLIEAADIEEVFRSTESGEAQFGVVPVENSTEGAVNVALDLMLDTTLAACNEVELRVAHCLLAHPDAPAVTRICAHEQALAQCRHWLAAHFPGIPLVAKASNAEAARSAATETETYAVASAAAAALYGLEIKERNIEDQPGNTTRFLVFSKDRARPSGQDKTSLIMSNPDQSGALYRLLSPLAEAGISMTKIESRPTRSGLWKYVFFIDIEGHLDDPQIGPALAAMQKASAFFKILGSYPRGA